MTCRSSSDKFGNQPRTSVSISLPEAALTAIAGAVAIAAATANAVILLTIRFIITSFCIPFFLVFAAWTYLFLKFRAHNSWRL